MTSTLMPTAFPPHIVPVVEVVDLPLSNVFPLKREKPSISEVVHDIIRNPMVFQLNVRKSVHFVK